MDRFHLMNVLVAVVDAQGFAAARDSLAASFGFASDSDTVGVSAQFLTENRDQAIDLLRQAITAPRFDADAIEEHWCHWDSDRGSTLANDSRILDTIAIEDTLHDPMNEDNSIHHQYRPHCHKHRPSCIVSPCRALQTCCSTHGNIHMSP